jgi:glutathionylspermidine synthase
MEKELEKLVNSKRSIIISGNTCTNKTDSICFPIIDNIIKKEESLFIVDVNNEYYNVIEDSINVIKDDCLVSIIRVISKANEKENKDTPLSTEEANSLIDNLHNTNITKVIDDVEDIMNAVVGEIEDEEN